MWIFCSWLLWFSDSADWMWPCDPWLPGKERWGYGWWGYSWGEPAPEDYQRSAWYAAFMCALVCMCETGCGHFFSQQRRQKVSHRDLGTLARYYTLGNISQLLFPESFWEMDVWVIRLVRVWWTILSSCSEIESVVWGCIHHRCLFNCCDGSEASRWFTKLLVEIKENLDKP